MRWKFLGVMNALIVMVALFGTGSHHSILGWLAVAMTIPAAVGVFLYAYNQMIMPRFWQIFSWLFAIDSVGVLTFFFLRLTQVGSRHSVGTVALFLLIVVSYHYFTWLALHRLSTGVPREVPQSSERSERFAQHMEATVQAHPRRAKIAAWSLMIALLVTAPLVVWHRISEGESHRLIIPIVIGLVMGLRAYGAIKKARE